MSKILLLFIRGAGLGAKFLLIFSMGVYLNVEDIGIYGILLAVVVIYTHLGALGVGANFARRYEISFKRRNSVLFARQVFLYGVVFCVALILFFVFLFGYGELLDGVWWGIFVFSILIIIFELLSAEMGRVFIICGMNVRANILLFIRSGAWVFFVIFVFHFFELFRELWVVLALWVFGAFSAFLLGFFWLFKLLLISRLFFASIFLKGLGYYAGVVGKSFFVFGAMLLNALVIYSDRFIVAGLLGVDYVGVYTFYWSIVNALVVLVSATVIQSYYPKLTRVVSSVDDFSKLVKLFYRSALIFIIFISPLIYISVLLVIDFVGDVAIRDGFYIFGPLLFGAALKVFSESSFYIIYSAGLDKGLFYRMLLVFAVSVVFSFVSVSALGFIGVAVGQVFHTCFMFFVLTSLYRKFIGRG